MAPLGFTVTGLIAFESVIDQNDFASIILFSYQ
jgi:hypothetical protein